MTVSMTNTGSQPAKPCLSTSAFQNRPQLKWDGQVVAYLTKIPELAGQAGVLLLFVVALMATPVVGYGCGLVRHRDLFSTTMLSFLLMLVITLIIDLDRPRRGWIRGSQESMIRIQNSLTDAIGLSQALRKYLDDTIKFTRHVPRLPVEVGAGENEPVGGQARAGGEPSQGATFFSETPKCDSCSGSAWHEHRYSPHIVEPNNFS